MALKVIILFFILKSIAGAKIPELKTQSQSISPRIVGGVNAADGQAPFQCYIHDEDFGYVCGCAVVAAEWIITAAHCLEERSIEGVYIGVGTIKMSSGGQKYNPKEFITHESYDHPDYAYDIGLIRLQTPIKFSEKVQPIKLSTEEVKAGVEMQVFGWGLLSKKGENPDNLQVLNVTSISDEECKVKAMSHDSHLCTLGPTGEGICDGDSGGPLVFNNELVGVVNFNFPCARGRPDGFARISYLYQWIEKKVESK